MTCTIMNRVTTAMMMICTVPNLILSSIVLILNELCSKLLQSSNFLILGGKRLLEVLVFLYQSLHRVKVLMKK